MALEIGMDIKTFSLHICRNLKGKKIEVEEDRIKNEESFANSEIVDF